MTQQYVTNQELDRVIQSTERAVDSLAHIISNLDDKSSRLVEKVVTLENQIKDLRYDLSDNLRSINGDGSDQGIKIKIHLILKDLEDIKSRLDRNSMVRVEDQQEAKKASGKKEIVLISGLIAIVLEGIKFLSQLFM